MRLNRRMNHITKCRLSTFFSLLECFTERFDRKTKVKLILRNLYAEHNVYLREGNELLKTHQMNGK